MKLPQIAQRPQRAERPSMAAVSPTDLGLGAVARDMGEWAAEVKETEALEDEVERATAEEAVAPLLRQFETEFEGEFAQAGGAWDGVSPGFARQVNENLTARATGYGDDQPLTSTERDALRRGMSRYGQSVGQRSIQYEAQRRGAIEAEAAGARMAAVTGGLTARYMTDMAARQAARDGSFDGSTADYVSGSLADHDAVATEIIAAAPPGVQARVATQLATERLRLQGRAMDVQARGQQAFVIGQVRAAGDATVNAVLSAPSMYDQAIGQIDQLVAPLPAAAQGAERARLTDSYTDAYVGALIRDGNHDQAITLLNGGTLDNRLQPATKDRLLSLAVRARDEPDVNDYIAALQANALADDNVASIAATGQPIEGADPAALGAQLGPEGLARYSARIEEARRIHAATPGFSGMSGPEIAAHVESLRPQPGQAGFADAQQRYDLAARSAAAEIKAREDDPAAWAAQAAPTLRTALNGLAAADPQERQRSAAAYATGQMALQAEAGIPERERRVFSKAAAAEIVATAEGDPDPANGLRGLSSVLEAFAPPTRATPDQLREGWANRNRVIAELRAAGADPGDIAAALDLGNDPVRLGRYVAATRGEAFEKLQGEDKTDLEAAVDRAMGPYLQSWAGVPGSADLTAGRRLMAQRLAAERIASRGGSERDAATEAVNVVSGEYVFVSQQGWRMPRRLAEARDPTTNRPQSGYAQAGAARQLAALALNDGAGFYTPADNGRGMSAEQRRRRYADTVRSSGRWFTTADDAGLVLMTPNLDGGWTPALDTGGRPIARAWSQLVNAGRPTRTEGGVERGGGYARASDQPRGIRNNNPGNIEFRAENPWRGQTGSDGRFARFATPEAGIRALAIDLGTKSQRGLNTVTAILNAYAPESENDTRAYIRAVSTALGVSPTARLDLNDPRIRAGLMGAIISHENGMQPYSNEMIARQAREAIRR